VPRDPKDIEQDLPSTLERSPRKAQRTYAKTKASAEEQYGEGEVAERTAWASVKHQFEKVGGRWEPKDEMGPSDPRGKQGSTAAKRRGRGETYGGVDAEGNTKDELYARARALDVQGRSRMSKAELARAVARKQ
jgi:cation transport regulator ChaB